MIVGMGFPEDDVRAAMRAAFNNPDVAVAYLTGSIPMPTGPRAGESSGAAPGGEGASPLDALRRMPQLNALRRQVQENPASLPQVLAAIGQASPALMHWISEHQAEFLNLMNEPVEEGEEDMGDDGDDGEDIPGMPGGMNMQMMLAQLAQMPREQRAALAAQMGIPPQQLEAMLAYMRASGAGGGAEGAGDEEGIPPGATVIRLTAEEAEQVQQVCVQLAGARETQPAPCARLHSASQVLAHTPFTT